MRRLQNLLSSCTSYCTPSLIRRLEPFDHPDWIYEIKFDGFRALAYTDEGKCRLLSSRRHEYKSFHELCASVAHHLNGHEALLDGEIVCLDQYGRSQFKQLMFRLGQPFFYTFDLLWLNAEDLRSLPLVYIEEGKCRLAAPPRVQILPRTASLDRRGAREECGPRNRLLGSARSNYELMFRRGEPFFYAFDLLWLLERKRRLRELCLQRHGSANRLLYLDHLERNGSGLFAKACELDTSWRNGSRLSAAAIRTSSTLAR